MPASRRAARLPLLLAIVGLVASLSGCAGGIPPWAWRAAPASTPTPSRSCLDTATGGPYVRSDGRSLVCGSAPLSLTGFTFYPAVAGGASAWRRPGFTAYVDHILSMGAAAGQNLVRITDQWDPHAAGQSATDPAVWANMDYVLRAAQARGMYVVVDVSAYRWLLTSQGADPWDPARWQGFLASVGARYRDDNAIAFYSISGEPTPPRNGAQLDALLAFYRSTTAALRAADPNHLITVGGFNHMEEGLAAPSWWQSVDSLPDNDLVAVKTYSQRDVNLMPSIAAFARSIDKPVVEDEFGMPQGYGDAAFAGGATYNGLAGGRAPFFQSVYQTGRELGYAAFVFWNLGCQTGPTSYEVNPMTPAVWSVVKRFGAAPSRVAPTKAAPLCP